MKLISEMKRAILLTGVKLLKIPKHLYYLMRMVRPDLTPNFYEFGYRYCDPRQAFNGINFDHFGNMMELKHTLDKRIRVRQRRGVVFDELTPSKIKFEVTVDITAVVKIQHLIKSYIVPWEEQEKRSFFVEMFESQFGATKD